MSKARIARVIRAASKRYGVYRDAFRSTGVRKGDDISRCRHISWWIMQRGYDLSAMDIAYHTGFSVPAVYYGASKIEDQLRRRDPKTVKEVEAVALLAGLNPEAMTRPRPVRMAA